MSGFRYFLRGLPVVHSVLGKASYVLFLRDQPVRFCYSTPTVMICYFLFKTRIYLILQMILQSMPAIST